MKKTIILTLLSCILPFAARLQTISIPITQSVSKSNSYTRRLVEIENRYSPEKGSAEGLAQFDSLISVPSIANQQAERVEKEKLVKYYESAITKENDPFVLQDLHLLIDLLKLGFRQQDFELSRKVTYFNVASIIYDGLKTLLDDQTTNTRRAATIIRLKKYAGTWPGYQPLTEILKARTSLQMIQPNVLFPSRQKMETELSRSASIVDGISKLCKKYNLSQWEEPFELLSRQVDDYNQWVKENILIKGRNDFRLDPQEYKLKLEAVGITVPPAEIAEQAHAAFIALQQQMVPIAAEIAKKRHLDSADYRYVMRILKKEQIQGDAIIPLYQRNLINVQNIIRDHHLVTLPERPAIIRLASAAETALSPPPHMIAPPLLNNSGQRGVFVLPLNMPQAAGEKIDRYDDFTFEAASWTLIAHEARPGHELQFDKMVEEGVSNARSLYAFNSTNVEGWGLYAESIILPYMPLEGQLVSLDYRLLRAARAFLDPELQAGMITQSDAMAVLMEDVVQSHAMAQQEVERYTFNQPGQATSYFYGFTKMVALRKDTEKALGSKFNAQHFHDFILAQGLLTPALIRQAVFQNFIPSEK